MNVRQLNRVRAVSYYFFFRASVINYSFIVAYYCTCLQYQLPDFLFPLRNCICQLSSERGVVACNGCPQYAYYSFLVLIPRIQLYCLVLQFWFFFFQVHIASATLHYIQQYNDYVFSTGRGDSQNSSFSWCHMIAFFL